MSIIQTIVQTSDLFFEITSNQENLDIRTLIGNTLYNAGYRKRVIIPSSVTVGSASTAASAIQIPSGLGGELVIDNYGSIQGAGGAAGGTGGDAIVAQSVCRVNNKPTGTIYAGGGGGGTGGTGGTGGPGAIAGSPYLIYGNNYCVVGSTCPGTPSLCAPGYVFFDSCFPGPFPICPPAIGPRRYSVRCYSPVPGNPTPTTGGAGGSGGGGGAGRGYNQSPTTGSTGAAGSAGGTNAGSGGTGGTGGTGGDWGTPGDFGLIGNVGANGNVGNGSAGASGGAGGQAGYYINGLSTYVTLTNNGTVAGRED